jgi:hypothetical protein
MLISSKMPIVPTVSLFLDESGKFQDSEVVSMGGLLLAPATNRDLSQSWTNRIESDGLPYTSMKDAINFTGPFYAWRADSGKEQRRDVLLNELASMICAAPALQISACMRSAQFRQLSQEQRKLFRNDLHYAVFESCVIGAVVHLSEWPPTVMVACDLSEQYSEECVKLFHLLRKTKDAVKRRCSGITFADDEKVPALQMADMLSYCMRVSEMGTAAQPHPVVSRLIEKFAPEDRKQGMILYRTNGTGLGDAELRMT